MTVTDRFHDMLGDGRGLSDEHAAARRSADVAAAVASLRCGACGHGTLSWEVGLRLPAHPSTDAARYVCAACAHTVTLLYD